MLLRFPVVTVCVVGLHARAAACLYRVQWGACKEQLWLGAHAAFTVYGDHVHNSMYLCMNKIYDVHGIYRRFDKLNTKSNGAYRNNVSVYACHLKLRSSTGLA